MLSKKTYSIAIVVLVVLYYWIHTSYECRDILSDVRVCEFRYEFLNSFSRYVENLF